MLWTLVEHGGVVAVVITALSLYLWAVIFERIAFWRDLLRMDIYHRPKVVPGIYDHEVTLRPLAELATGLAVVGSLSGMNKAYGGFSTLGVNLEAVFPGVARGVFTSIFSMSIALASMVACYVCSILAQRINKQS